MLSIAKHTGRALPARRRRLALAGALACLAVLLEATPAAAFPTNTVPPGPPERSGRTLTTANGSWLLTSSYSYAWYRCNSIGEDCAGVPGPTGPTYVLTSADVGRRIRSFVTGSSGLGSASVFSAPTETIGAAPPLNQAPPTVSGPTFRGSTLSAGLGSWTDPRPDRVVYRRQWQRCTPSDLNCLSIAGANDASYTLTPEDVGHFIRVSVLAEGLGLARVESAPVGPISDLPGPGEDTAPGVLRKLRPFPRIVVAGRLLRGRTHISRLVVTGPRGATVSVRCRGRGCRTRSYRAKLGRSRRIRLRRFQRTYSPGAVIEIRVTGPRAIGKYTRIRIRATRPPGRSDACVVPGKSRPSRCP